MNKRMRALVVVGVVSVLSIVGGAAAFAQSVEITDEEAAEALLDALTGPEGEYAAYASYAAVLETYGDVEPYATIAAAELRHIEALQRLLDKYSIDYPEINSYLGTIEAPADLQSAAEAWDEGEVANVALYEELLAAVAEYSDITQVFLNLQAASQDAHLPAFEAAAESGGVLTSVQDGTAYQGGASNGQGNRGNGPCL